MNTIYLKMGERISLIRVEKGMSREALAEEASISPKFLYEIENGKKGFSVLVLYRLCESLGVTSKYIMTGERDPVEHENMDGE